MDGRNSAVGHVDSLTRPNSKLWCGLLCGVLLFLGVFDSYAARQTTHQVLVQIVNDFEKVTREIDAKDTDASSSSASSNPISPKGIECGTDSKHFGVYNANDVS